MLNKFFVILFSMFLLSTPVFAIGVDNSKYFDKGLIYSGSSFPQSVANDINNDKENVDISRLKQGKSSSRNYFGLVEVGDSSIMAASKMGKINKIYYVDSKINKVYVPYFIIPVYVKEKATVVYGE